MADSTPTRKAPAYQYYPDKWQSHTRHLSDAAYRDYHDILDWMWLHSPDQVSIPADPNFIAVALARPVDRIKTTMAEIQNVHMKLLVDSEDGHRLISNGLRKEVAKQEIRRNAALAGASGRWGNAMRSHGSSVPPDPKTGKPLCSPIGDGEGEGAGESSSSEGGAGGAGLPLPQDVYERHPELRSLHLDTPYLRGLTLEQFLICVHNRSPHMDLRAAVTETIKAANLTGVIAVPGRFVNSCFSRYEKDHAEVIAQKTREGETRQRAIADMVKTIRELAPLGDTKPEGMPVSASTILDRMTVEFAKSWGKAALAEATKRSLVDGKKVDKS